MTDSREQRARKVVGSHDLLTSVRHRRCPRCAHPVARYFIPPNAVAGLHQRKMNSKRSQAKAVALHPQEGRRKPGSGLERLIPPISWWRPRGRSAARHQCDLHPPGVALCPGNNAQQICVPLPRQSVRGHRQGGSRPLRCRWPWPMSCRRKRHRVPEPVVGHHFRTG